MVTHFQTALKAAADATVTEFRKYAYPVSNNSTSGGWGHNVRQPSYATSPILYLAEFTIYETMSHNSLYTVLSGGGKWDPTEDPFGNAKASGGCSCTITSATGESRWAAAFLLALFGLGGENDGALRAWRDLAECFRRWRRNMAAA